METLIATLVSIQAFGAVIGAAFAVWAEVAYIRAAHDGAIDRAERAHLVHIARGLRFGMLLLLLASLGLVIADYRTQAALQPALQSAYWIQAALAFAVIALSWALSRRRISFALGSAGVFSAWWFLALLALGKIPALAFGSAVAVYVLVTAVLFAVLWYARMLALPRR